jgi:Skp family chaperone for outer membrane proteins
MKKVLLLLGSIAFVSNVYGDAKLEILQNNYDVISKIQTRELSSEQNALVDLVVALSSDEMSELHDAMTADSESSATEALNEKQTALLAELNNYSEEEIQNILTELIASAPVA